MPVKGRITTEIDADPVEEPVSAPVSEPTQFNFKKYTLSLETEKRTLTIGDTGETFEVTIRPMSWAKRNQIISTSLKFGADGSTGFDGDTYLAWHGMAWAAHLSSAWGDCYIYPKILLCAFPNRRSCLPSSLNEEGKIGLVIFSHPHLLLFSFRSQLLIMW